MGLGILELAPSASHVPGTVTLLHEEDTDLVFLNPRPSESVNDPLVRYTPGR